jgi:hypothetical protein
MQEQTKITNSGLGGRLKSEPSIRTTAIDEEVAGPSTQTVKAEVAKAMSK